MNDWSVLHDPAPVKPLGPVVLVSREPWWVLPPLQGQDEMACEWGFLEFYSDGSTKMIHERPSDDEILNRKGCRLPESLREAVR